MSLVSQIQSLSSRIASEIKALKARPRALMIAASDETTPLTTGTKLTFRLPHAMTLTNVRASLTSASTSGSVIVDVRAGGTSVFSGKPSFGSGSKAQAGTLTSNPIQLADDTEITVVIDSAGTNATGLKISLIGTV